MANFLELEQQVKKIIASLLQVPVDAINSDALLVEDLGFDSLFIIELIQCFEDDLDLSFPMEDFFPMRMTVYDLTKQLSELLSSEQCVPWPAVEVCGSESEQTELSLAPIAKMPDPIYEREGSNEAGYPTYRRRSDNMLCVLIPGSVVSIGSEAGVAMADEKPVHDVVLDAFLIDTEPISNWAYARFLNCIGEIPKPILEEWIGEVARGTRKNALAIVRKKGLWRPLATTESKPMVMVSWYGANAYSLWANALDWRYYCGDGTIEIHKDLCEIAEDITVPEPENMWSRLPSEAQWEYAARGKTPQLYPWGDDDPTPELVCAAQHRAGDSYRDTADFRSVNVNAAMGMSPFGLHHMAGNVWNWCRDWYEPNFYGKPEAVERNAQNLNDTGVRSERGGSWVGPLVLVRSSYRRGRAPSARGRCLGFRCIGKFMKISSEMT